MARNAYSERLHDFVMRVHTFAVMNPGTDFVSRFGTPQAISDVNSLLEAERFNSLRASIGAKRNPLKPTRRVS